MLKIKADRLLKNLEDLAQIGQTADGGVSRPALSAADVAGRDWFKQKVEEVGLEFRADGAGNLSAFLPCADPGAQTLLAGSHLDTVPNGGRFDGALGVLTALEALQTIREAGLDLPYHLEAISFTDEEASVFAMLGSRALTGQLTAQALAQADEGSEAFREGLARLNLTHAGILSARRKIETLAGYVELHIEQGTRLEEAELHIGVVPTIVGIRHYWLHFKGQAAHAGTMPMDKRADALWGATDFMVQARALVMEQFSPGVMNCGQIHAAPGSFNIVPAEVQLALEFRHGTEQQIDQMETALFELAHNVAQTHHLTLTTTPRGGCIAAPMGEDLMEAVEQAADRLGLRHTRLMSFAGHDAQTMAAVLPSALFFVPSVDGISHNPREFTQTEDVINGANVLLHTLLILAGE